MANVALLRRRINKKGSGAFLAKALELPQCTPEIPPAISFDNLILINWGCSTYPKWWPEALAQGGNFVNNPQAIKRSVNKKTTLEFLIRAGISAPIYTTKQEIAQKWYDNGEGVMVRQRIKSSRGRGLIFRWKENELNLLNTPIEDAGLYTRYIPPEAEYRAHVMGDEIIDLIQKRRMRAETLKKHGIAKHNNFIRSHGNGWAFTRKDIHLPSQVYRELSKAIKVLGLDFGAIDFVVPENKNFCMAILEVNTAPAVTDKNTKSAYINALVRKAGEINSDPTQPPTHLGEPKYDFFL